MIFSSLFRFFSDVRTFFMKINEMLTSTPTKDKKKNSSPSKQLRHNTSATLKRNPNYDLKKDELIQLLTRFEGELQAKEIALATLKAEKMKNFFLIGRFSSPNHPIGALLRDDQCVGDDVLLTSSSENPSGQLEEFRREKQKEVEVFEKCLEQSEKRCLLLSQQLENERREKTRFQSFEKLCRRLEEEKFQLRNELNDVKLHNKELEQQLIQLMKFIEFEHERHKKFVVLFLNERKNEKNRTLDEQNENRLKELENENERNKEILTGKIRELQNEIDRLVVEKKSEENSTLIRRPTVIPTPSTSKLNGKTSIITPVPQSSSIPCRTTNSIVENPSSPVSTTIKRQIVPTRPITNLSPSNIPRNPTGGIPRLTKNPSSIVKPTTTTTTTGPTKRPGQLLKIV